MCNFWVGSVGENVRWCAGGLLSFAGVFLDWTKILSSNSLAVELLELVESNGRNDQSRVGVQTSTAHFVALSFFGYL